MVSQQARRLGDSVQWHEGMLLTPQHFQQYDLGVQAKLWHHTLQSNPYAWGIDILKYDPAGLITGILKVTELQAVLPDGSLVYYDASIDPELSFNLATLGNMEFAAPVKIYLGVATYRPTGGNVRGELPRYSALSDSGVLDENIDDRPSPVNRLRFKPYLIAEKDISGRFVGFPIVEIIYKDDSYSLTSYMPPQCAVTRSSVLGQAVFELLSEIRRKLNYLAEKIQAPLAPDILAELKHIYRLFVAELPTLETMMTTEKSHPYEIYLSLMRFVGSLAALRPTQVPAQFAGYRHVEIMASSEEALNYIRAILNHIQDPYTMIPFACEGRTFKLNITPEWAKDDLIIGIRLHQNLSEQEAVKWIESAIIASEKSFVTAKERRIFGAARSSVKIDQEAGGLPTKNIVLYTIHKDPAFVGIDQALLLNNASEDPVRCPFDVFLCAKR